MSYLFKKSYLPLSVCLGLIALASGALAKEWPAPIKALEAKGLEIVGTFDAPGGLTGYAGILQQQPLAVYVTSDGKQAIIGSMLTRRALT